MSDELTSTTQVGTDTGTAEGKTETQSTLPVEESLEQRRAELERQYAERQAQMERGFERKMTEWGQEMHNLREEIRQSRPPQVDPTWQQIEEQAPDIAPLVKPLYERNNALERQINELKGMLQPIVQTTAEQRQRAQEIAAIKERYPGEDAEAIYAQYQRVFTDPWQLVDSFVKTRNNQAQAGQTAAAAAGKPAPQTVVLPSGPGAENGMTQQEAQRIIDAAITDGSWEEKRASNPEAWSLLRLRAAGQVATVR